MRRLPLFFLLLVLLSGCAQLGPNTPPQVENPSAPEAEPESEDPTPAAERDEAPLLEPAAFGLENHTTWDCGGEGESPCGIGTAFFWENGNLFADRGLMATGFNVLPDISFNANDWIDLTQIDATQYEPFQESFQSFYEDLDAKVSEIGDLVTTDWEALEARISNLTTDDFTTPTCIGTLQNGTCWTTPPFDLDGWDAPDEIPFVPEGCVALEDVLDAFDFLDAIPEPNCTIRVPGTPGLELPVPTFEEPGWDVPEDLATFIDDVVEAVDELASVQLVLPDGEIVIPPFLKGIPEEFAAIPEAVLGEFSSDPDVFDLANLEDALDDFKTFFSEDNQFLVTFRGLYEDFVDPPGIVVNDTRRQEEAGAFQDTWSYWALMDQRSLSSYEPLNWTQYINTHNAFNSVADGYIIPNQRFSVTDQLRMGSRGLSLDIHWFNDNLRLCHGKAEHEGCSGVDRYYDSVIKEIADWLAENPDEVVVVGFEDRSDGHDDYVNDPIATHLGSLAYTPGVGNQAGFGGSGVSPAEQYWPSLDEIRQAGKQILFFSDDQHGGEWIWKREGNPFSSAREKNFHYTSADYDGSGEPPAYDGGDYACWSYWDGGSTFDFDRRGEDSKVGFFTSIYEARSVLDPFDETGLLSGDDIANVATCPITEIGLDFFNATEWTNPGVCGGEIDCQDPDERVRAAIWSWSEGDHGDNGNAALLDPLSGRWRSVDPGEHHHFVCAPPREGPASGWTDPAGDDWKITEGSGPWTSGGAHCLEEYGHEGYFFAVPVTGWQNEQLKRANVDGLELWLNYNDIQQEGTWLLNRRPNADAGDDLTVEEGERLHFDASGSTDPDGNRLSYHWDFGDGETGTGDSPGHIYADNGNYTVTLTVDDGFSGVDRTTITVDVRNVAPSVDPITGQRIVEGGEVALAPVNFSDPGFDCPGCSPASSETFRATIDWGEGTVEVGSVTRDSGGPGTRSTGSVAGSHAYGDDGSYQVKVCVSDDDGAQGCGSFTVEVTNEEPSVVIDEERAIDFPSGDRALLARRGVAHEFDADASDRGSDDLTVTWIFPPSTLGETITYFNDSNSADPYPSPHGTFPFEIAAPNVTTFSHPGVYSAEVEVEDDDMGRDQDDIPLLVTDGRTCTLPSALWSHQFGSRGRQLIDDERLQAYLSVIRFASSAFDESNLATLADAAAQLEMGGRGNDASSPLRREVLAAWLDFVAGGVGWEEVLPRADGLTFAKLMNDVEAVLLDPNSSRGDLRDAQRLVRTVHNSHPGNPSCDG